MPLCSGIQICILERESFSICSLLPQLQGKRQYTLGLGDQQGVASIDLLLSPIKSQEKVLRPRRNNKKFSFDFVRTSALEGNWVFTALQIFLPNQLGVCLTVLLKRGCAVRPVFARVVGELQAADPSNLQRPVKQNASPGQQSEAPRPRWQPGQEQQPGPENQDSQHMLEQPRARYFPEISRVHS